MFGVPYSSLDLALLPQYESEIPCVLTVLESYLQQHDGFATEGLFRVNGKEETFMAAMSTLDRGERLSDVDGIGNLIVGQLIKAFFREYEIPSPGFFSDALLNAKDDADVKREFNLTEEPIKSMLLWLFDLCLEAVKHEESNKMTLDAVSICFAINFVRNPDPTVLLQLQRSSQSVFKRMLQLRGESALVMATEEVVEAEERKDDEEASLEREDAFPTMPRYAQRRASLSAQSRSHSVKLSYKPSLSTGVYGSYYYPRRDALNRMGAVSESESKVEAEFKGLDIHSTPSFVLKFAGDDEEHSLPLSNEEREHVENLSNLLSSRYNYEDIAYSELVRFVIGCKLRMAVAERRFLNLKKLEQQFALNAVSISAVRDELKKAQYMLCGRDKQGSAIVGFSIRHFVKKQMRVAVMMKALMVLVDAISSDVEVCRNGVVVLLDMNGLSKDKLALDLEKVFIKAFQDCYPMRIRQFIIVDAPVLVRAAVQLGKLVLSKKLSSRIVSVKSTPETGSLWQYVDGKEVPRCINGTFDEGNDGSRPSNAWQLVCSKVIGDDSEATLQRDEDEDDDEQDIKEDVQEEVSTAAVRRESKKEAGRKMFAKLSSGIKSGASKAKSKAKSGASIAKSKAKSGMSAGLGKAKSGANKAKSKISQKREERKAKQEQRRQSQSQQQQAAELGTSSVELGDSGDDDLGGAAKPKVVQRLSFNQRSEEDFLENKAQAKDVADAPAQADQEESQ